MGSYLSIIRIINRVEAVVESSQVGEEAKESHRSLDFLKRIIECQAVDPASLQALEKNIYVEGDSLSVDDSDRLLKIFMGHIPVLSGTEVPSCQNVNGDLEKNRCLLGYCLDGKNRLIPIKDRDGKIVARKLLRVLWNPATARPILLQERFYKKAGLSEDMESIIDAFIVERANKLGLDLVEGVYRGEDLHVVVSLGSPAPYEYFDCARGVKTGEERVEMLGQYIIGANI